MLPAENLLLHAHEGGTKRGDDTFTVRQGFGIKGSGLLSTSSDK